MQALRFALTETAETETPALPFNRTPLHAAVLSDRPARLVAALAEHDITAIDATPMDLALLVRDAPDMVVIDLDGATMPSRRIALLVAQLGWLRRDLVIAVSRRCAPHVRGFAIDVIFDGDADAETLATRLGEASRLLQHSRLRPVEAAAPAAPVLFQRSARRVSLFR